jgi:hypothetical protein
MAEVTLTEGQAFLYLRRVSTVTNIELRDVVANIVEKAEAEICHRGHARPGPLRLLRGAGDERRRVRSYRWH